MAGASELFGLPPDDIRRRFLRPCEGESSRIPDGLQQHDSVTRDAGVGDGDGTVSRPSARLADADIVERDRESETVTRGR